MNTRQNHDRPTVLVRRRYRTILCRISRTMRAQTARPREIGQGAAPQGRFNPSNCSKWRREEIDNGWQLVEEYKDSYRLLRESPIDRQTRRTSAHRFGCSAKSWGYRFSRNATRSLCRSNVPCTRGKHAQTLCRTAWRDRSTSGCATKSDPCLPEPSGDTTRLS